MSGMQIDAARVDIGFFSLADLIRTAYAVKAVPGVRSRLDVGAAFRHPGEDAGGRN